MSQFRSGWAATLLTCMALGWSADAEDLSLYLVGNSITDAVRAGDLERVAAAAGHDLTYGQHLVWGGSIDWLWDHPDQASKLSSSDQPFGSRFGLWTDALPNHTWDAVSLQPFQRPLATADNDLGDLSHTLAFIDHTLQNPANRGARFLLYQDPPSKPADGRAVSFENWWLHREYTGAWDQSWDTSAYTYLLRDAVQAELDARPRGRRAGWPGGGVGGGGVVKPVVPRNRGG
ncbi:MAG: hypothetical protein AAGE65_12710, partial [Planctomycetota bacterium]